MALWEKEHYRVIIEPSLAHYIGDDPKKVADRIVADVRRHIDDVALVYVTHDLVCAKCRSPWESPPLCCDEAIDGWIRENPEWTLDENYNWCKVVGP